MELVEGETLEAMLLRVGRFNAREVALIGIDVCSALSAVHAAGLLHRDVKAQNVMRDRNGRLVLMDFGTGRDVESADEAPSCTTRSARRMYMAPELFDGGKASVQSDIYSVGVLLYRLVTGSVPVRGALAGVAEGRAPRTPAQVARRCPKRPAARVHSRRRTGPVARPGGSLPECRRPGDGAVGPARADGTAGTGRERAAAGS